MNVKRYFAQTAREALRALKEELGPEAIVLSNRAVEGGVEILALPADAVGAVQTPRRPAVEAAPPAAPAIASALTSSAIKPAAAALVDDADFHVSLSRLAAGAIPRAAAVQKAPSATVRPFSPPRIETPDYLARGNSVWQAGGYPEETPPPAKPAPAVQPFARTERPAAAPEKSTVQPVRETPRGDMDDARVRALQEANTRLMEELTGIRGMIERQLAGFAWGETHRHAPARAIVVGELLEAGFSAPLARRLGEAVGENATPDEARGAVRKALDRMLRARSCDDDIIDRGGVYALVGPTGVGKTTTTAKLAARCVVRHGAGRLALITTDGYRIGAQEQLRIYGRILGVPVFSVRDAADLRQTLAELRGKHMVLIDTMGMSQRDRAVAEQAAMLAGAGGVRRLLLLNATSRGDTLDDVVRAYSGADLEGVIFTKVDEAASLGSTMDVAVRHDLDVFYVANGQRVPEDLHLPNRAYLLHRALREQAAGSPWRLHDEDAGLMLSAAGTGA